MVAPTYSQRTVKDIQINLPASPLSLMECLQRTAMFQMIMLEFTVQYAIYKLSSNSLNLVKVNTTGWNFTENMFVAWELEGETQWNKNQELYRALYVAPNNMAWITLAKRWVQPLGFEKKLSDGSK